MAVKFCLGSRVGVCGLVHTSIYVLVSLVASSCAVLYECAGVAQSREKNRFITLIYTSQQSADCFVLGKRLTLTGLNLAVPFYFRDDYGTLVAMKIKGIKR